VAHRDHDGSRQGRDGVDLPQQDHGDLGGQQITDHTTADRGDHADHARAHLRDTGIERGHRSDHGEQTESRRVQSQHGLPQPEHPAVQPEDHRRGQARRNGIPPVGERHRRSLVDRHVAQYTAAQRGDHADDGDTEQVQPLRDRGSGTRCREHHDSGEVEPE